MVTPRSLIVTILAILCAASAALGIRAAAGRPTPTAPTPDVVPIVVVRSEVPRGLAVRAAAVEIRHWPRALAPEGALSALEDAIDRAALQTLVPGEPLFERKLAARGILGGMSSMIPAGLRAYTVQTQRVATNVAGFLLPGNLVDVLLTFRGSTQDETGGGSTSTLLQAVEVLAVGPRIDSHGEQSVDPKQADSVTLLVTPEQATRLDLGQSLGMLSLALRNPADREEVATSQATVGSIRFGWPSGYVGNEVIRGLPPFAAGESPPTAATAVDPPAPRTTPAPRDGRPLANPPIAGAVYGLHGSQWNVTAVRRANRK